MLGGGLSMGERVSLTGWVNEDEGSQLHPLL